MSSSLPDFDALLAVLRGKQPPTAAWTKGLDYAMNGFKPPIGQGSNNIPTCSTATALFVPADRSQAVDYFQKRWQAELGIAPIPDRVFWALGSQELGSSTYDGIEMAGEAAAMLGLLRAGAAEVAALGWQLLRRRAALLLLGATSQAGKPVAAIAGMRGTHRAGNDRDFILQRILAGNRGTGGSEVLQCWDLALQQLAAAWPKGGSLPAWPFDGGLVGMTPDQLAKELAGCQTVVPWHVRMWTLEHGSTAILTWVDNNVNSNTGCMYFWAWGPWQAVLDPQFGVSNYPWPASGSGAPQDCYGWPYLNDNERIREPAQGLGTGSCSVAAGRLEAHNLTQDEANGRTIVLRWIELPPGDPSWSFDLLPPS